MPLNPSVRKVTDAVAEYVNAFVAPPLWVGLIFAPVAAAAALGGVGAAIGGMVGVGWTFLNSFAHGMSSVGDQRSLKKVLTHTVLSVAIGTAIGASIFGSGVGVVAGLAGAGIGLAGSLVCAAGLLATKLYEREVRCYPKRLTGLITAASTLASVIGLGFGAHHYKDDIRALPGIRAIYAQADTGTPSKLAAAQTLKVAFAKKIDVQTGVSTEVTNPAFVQRLG